MLKSLTKNHEEWRKLTREERLIHIDIKHFCLKGHGCEKLFREGNTKKLLKQMIKKTEKDIADYRLRKSRLIEKLKKDVQEERASLKFYKKFLEENQETG